MKDGGVKASLENQIMNILADANKAGTDDARLAYLHGHRDARHAAAELALKADACIDALRTALELIAAPKRPDGTFNREREACREVAAHALERGGDNRSR